LLSVNFLEGTLFATVAVTFGIFFMAQKE